MIPTKDILELLFGQVASIVATVTGLIGAFSTFRLQNINTEVNILKDIVIHKNAKDGTTIRDFLKANDYSLLEKIFDHNMAAVELLKQIVTDNDFDKGSKEFQFDLDNVFRNQLLHDEIKLLSISGFRKALFFVFLSLLLLVFVDELILLGTSIWGVLIVYLAMVAYMLFLFVRQMEKLIG